MYRQVWWAGHQAGNRRGRQEIGLVDRHGVAILAAITRAMFRIYYPKAGLFDGTWKLPDVELVK